jgi:hypothetical protein
MNNRLKQHYEKLIYLNSLNHYTQSGNPKIDKYYRLLKLIKSQFINQAVNPWSAFDPTLNPIKQLHARR